MIREPDLYDDERAELLFLETGFTFSRRQICRACNKRGWTIKKKLVAVARQQNPELQDFPSIFSAAEPY
jgi:hypothetical protein